jgi:hypothetical protein
LSRFGSVKVSARSRYSMPARAKKSTSLVNAALMTFGEPATIGQEALSIVLLHPARDMRDAGVEDVVERATALLLVGVGVEQQLVDVGLDDLAREARVDGAVAAALAHISSLVGGENTTFSLRQAEGLQVGPEERADGVQVEHPGDADLHPPEILVGALEPTLQHPPGHPQNNDRRWTSTSCLTLPAGGNGAWARRSG